MKFRCALILLAGSVLAAADYTTFIGDSNEYKVAQIVSDSAGNTYVTGGRIFYGASSNAALAPQLSDVFVTKLDPTGSVVFTTTFGGKSNDAAKAIAVDAAGSIYVAGTTSSQNFPLHNALQDQASQSGSGFLVKLSADGSRFIYSTYIGGVRGPNWVNALAVDSAGNAYLTGGTLAPDFPVTSGLPAGHASMTGVPITSGAFVTKVSAAGDRILYSGVIVGNSVSCGAGSSCFLSSRNTYGNGIAVDAAGNAYIAGYTNTTDLATTSGAFLTKGIGAFVAKVNSAGTGLAYLTYLGAANYIVAPMSSPGNVANALAVDALGNAYVAGYTSDPKFPATPGAYQVEFAGPVSGDPYPPPPPDAFVAKLSPDGSSIVWATYLGGNADDYARSIALDSAGAVWITGTTTSSQFPNSDGWSTGGDFVTGLNASGSKLVYSARFPTGAAAQSIAAGAGFFQVAGTTGIVSAITPGQAPARRIFGIANAATGPLTGLVAPGEVISIYGPRLGPTTPAGAQLDSSGFISKTLADVQVLFDGIPAPLLYASETQINAVVPFELANQSSANVRLSLDGATTPDFPIALTAAVPEIFRNADGTLAAINQDGSRNSPDHPAKLGSLVAVWATGTGAISAADGEIATSAKQSYCCQALVNGTPAEVSYSGAAPGIVAGVTQINFRLPAEMYPGVSVVTVQISVGYRVSTVGTLFVTP